MQRLIFIESVWKAQRPSTSGKSGLTTLILGRTGRFGRKGVSINFVHDTRSWEEMHAIETELQHPILRVKTDDFDAMEKVCSTLFPPDYMLIEYGTTDPERCPKGLTDSIFCGFKRDIYLA